MFEPTPDTKKAIIEQDLQLWQNTLYQAQIRHRVQKLIGASTETLAAIEGDIARSLKAIDAYAVELAEVEKERVKGSPAEIRES